MNITEYNQIGLKLTDYLDVAVRDIVMAIGAFVLAKLSAITDRAVA